MINGCGLNAYIAIEHDPALRDAPAYYEMLRTVMLLHQSGTHIKRPASGWAELGLKVSPEPTSARRYGSPSPLFQRI